MGAGQAEREAMGGVNGGLLPDSVRVLDESVRVTYPACESGSAAVAAVEVSKLERPGIGAAHQGLGGAADHAFEARAGDERRAGGVAYHRRVGGQRIAAAASADVEAGAGGEDPFQTQPAVKCVEQCGLHGASS